MIGKDVNNVDLRNKDLDRRVSTDSELKVYLDPIKLDNWQVAKASLSPNCEVPVKIGFTARHLGYFRQPIKKNRLTAPLDVGIATGSVSSLMA